jgi:hypothetical protein
MEHGDTLTWRAWTTPSQWENLGGTYYDRDYSRISLRQSGYRYEAELVPEAASTDEVTLHADALASGGELERLNAIA